MTLSTAKAGSPAADQADELARALGEAGEEEYQSLLCMVGAARGRFAVMPVECDFRPKLRDALLERLRADLVAQGMTLRILHLSREVWNVFACLVPADGEAMPDAAVVVGLDETPDMVLEPGAKRRRPPALSALNLAREAFHKRFPAPLLVWCDPPTYTALQEHAPDFFDHYISLFAFLDAAPAPMPEEDSEARPLDIKPSAIARLEGISSPSAVRFYEEQVTRLKEPTVERARALVGLAQSLWSLRGSDRPARLSRAKAAAEEALTLLSPDDGRDWARTQSLLGILYFEWPTGDRAENLEKAIVCFEAALNVYTEAGFPRDWGLAHNNLGNAYGNLPTGDSAENRRLAIAYYEVALRVLTEARFPYDWALAQTNLGSTYVHLLTGDRAENLRRAVAHFEAALRVRTEVELPYEWAATLTGLGAAYTALSTSDRGENLRRAIACYEAALRIRTETTFPYEWAETQHDLGHAYSYLPTGDRRGNLRRSIAHYEAALRVFAEADYPREWATTQFNIGNNLVQCARELGEDASLPAARDAFAAAARGYRAAALDVNAADAEQRAAAIDAELAFHTDNGTAPENKKGQVKGQITGASPP